MPLIERTVLRVGDLVVRRGGNAMEEEFFSLYERQSLLAVEVGHNSIADWGVHIYERRGKEPGNWGEPVISESGPDRKLVFARAYIALTEYLSNTQGGY